MFYKAVSIFLLIAVSGFGQTEIVFFNESTGSSVYYDPSWGYKTAPSSLELINSSKFPVETGHVFLGSHALRLHWTSAPGGDWGIAIASPGWTAYNLTNFDSISFMGNSAVSMAAELLPQLAIEDMNNHKSSRVKLSLFSTALDSNETSWQKFTVPLSAFTPGNENCDFTKIKTIFFYQDTSDNANHVLYLDEVKVIGSSSGSPDVDVPQNLTAKGCDNRVDLKWRVIDSPDVSGFHVYRSLSPSGPFNRLTTSVRNFPVYSDFTGINNETYYYYVRTVSSTFSESLPSDTVSATTYAMSDEELLTSVQEATFRYFYDYGHPVSGLARERSNGYSETCTSGGTGMGLITLIVGAERGFEPYDSVAARVLKILTFLEEKTTRYHGAWPHWFNGRTGQTIPFSTYDDGGDLVETAYLVQGILTIRQYFKADHPVENEIRERATRLWEAVEWDWYLRYANGTVLFWHWSPTYSWKLNMEIRGFNECMITYLLAEASPTHPIPAQAYHSGWAQNGAWPYINGKTLFGYKQWVGWDYGGPLFFTQYSFLGFDPRNKADKYCNYFDNNRNISLINRAYCMENPRNHTGYSSLVWGLTASDDPWGYQVHEPNYSDRDNGTITPTAALSAMPYTPEESIATLKHFYFTYGQNLWGPFGFRDAFHLKEQWFSESYIAIDQGTIVPMMENYRSGLCWDAFMANPEISPMLDKLGFTVTNIPDEPPAGIDRSFSIRPAWPNPFNSRTIIELAVRAEMQITSELFDTAGRKLQTIFSNKVFPAGNHKINLQGDKLASGVYLIRLSNNEMSKTLKVVLIR